MSLNVVEKSPSCVFAVTIMVSRGVSMKRSISNEFFFISNSIQTIFRLEQRRFENYSNLVRTRFDILKFKSFDSKFNSNFVDNAQSQSLVYISSVPCAIQAFLFVHYSFIQSFNKCRLAKILFNIRYFITLCSKIKSSCDIFEHSYINSTTVHSMFILFLSLFGIFACI